MLPGPRSDVVHTNKQGPVRWPRDVVKNVVILFSQAETLSFNLLDVIHSSKNKETPFVNTQAQRFLSCGRKNEKQVLFVSYILWSISERCLKCKNIHPA